MTVQLHLLNARGTLESIRARVEDVFPPAVETISALLPVSNIDVLVQAGPAVIPEIGIGGYTLAADLLRLTIDPASPNLLKDFATEFLAVLGHELHHCLRYDGPGYGRTLGEALVSEGLACHFESELRGSAPFYARVLDQGALQAMRARAHLELESNSYNHNAWFYGSVDLDIPRCAGYALGFSIVEHYIHRWDTRASRLWNVPAETFYGGF